MLRVDGDSMIEDGILNGDYIIAKKIQIAQAGDTVIASIDGETTLKRFYIGSNGIELHPRNRKYNIIHVGEEDEFIIHGKLVAVIKVMTRHQLHFLIGLPRRIILNKVRPLH